MIAIAITPHGTDIPTAMATTFERLIDGLGADAEVGVEEAEPEPEPGPEPTAVADAAVIAAVAAGDAGAACVAPVVEAAVVVVARSPGTPMAQYASKTSIALEACSETIDDSHRFEMARVIRLLIRELESVQKHV